MKVLVIGMGSIGQRHCEVLQGLEQVERVDSVSRKASTGATYGSLDAVVSPEIYDYFVIANETYRHYETLEWITTRMDGKTILVEKPLYEKPYTLDLKSNRVYVAYNLRFHPLMGHIRKEIAGEALLYANAIVGQYLPTWRPGRDYRESYSASSKKGGGVLRDLSHELDYLCWLAGPLASIEAIDTKVSSLEIDAEDLFTAIGRTEQGSVINVSMDYISKIPLRQLILHTNGKTLIADLIRHVLHIVEVDGTERTLHSECERNETYKRMHHSLIVSDGKSLCTYAQGLGLVHLIESVLREGR